MNRSDIHGSAMLSRIVCRLFTLAIVLGIALIVMLLLIDGGDTRFEFSPW